MGVWRMPNSEKGHRSPRRRSGANAGQERSAHSGDSADESALWAAVSHGDEWAIERLAKCYSPLALFIARASIGRGIGISELEDEAIRALRQAICKYETARADGFKAFAT